MWISQTIDGKEFQPGGHAATAAAAAAAKPVAGGGTKEEMQGPDHPLLPSSRETGAEHHVALSKWKVARLPWLPP